MPDAEKGLDTSLEFSYLDFKRHHFKSNSPRGLTMATVAVRHRVENYEAWRAGYDEHGPVRKSHNCTGDLVLRDETDPNEVFVLTYWPSLADAHAFAADPSLPDAKPKAGVVGAPRIEIYEEAGI